MNLIDAIKLYCHILQREGPGIDSRKIARSALLDKGMSLNICNAIADTVSNDGHITSGNGNVFALTQISSS